MKRPKHGWRRFWNGALAMVLAFGLICTPNAGAQASAVTKEGTSPAGTGTVYYVSPGGSDQNSGTAEQSPWKSLDKVNATAFQPGDSVLFEGGGMWSGYLWPKGSGEEGSPITLGAYGQGYPVIAGSGTMPFQWEDRGGSATYNPTVLLSDQQHWVIDGLEVTNSFSTKYNNAGILLFTTGVEGVTADLTVRNCYVHDVTATSGNEKMTGGILVVGSETWLDGNQPAKEQQGTVGFRGVLVEDNYVKNVAQEGVRSTGQGSKFRNTKAHRDITFRGNYIEEIYGDGIVMSEVKSGGMVENNVVKNHCNTSGANYAGAWMWYCEDTIFRYNEVFGGEYGYNDGEAFDFDIGCTDTSYYHNYSHDNNGGLLLTMYSSTTYDFAYNISANDGKASQELFHGATGGNRVYNNTMYIGKGKTTAVFSGGSLQFFKNNIVLAHGAVPSLASGGGSVSASVDGVTNNIFYPASIVDQKGLSEEVKANNLYVEPRLSAPQLSRQEDSIVSKGLTYETMGRGQAFIDGLRGRMSIFKLTADSPAINAGTAIDNAPTADIFGNPIVGSPDIGAHEFTNDPGPTDPDIAKAEKVVLNKSDMYMTQGELGNLSAFVTPLDALDTSVTFVSSNPAAATVDQAGKITAVAPGETVITATANSNPQAKDTCAVYVYAKDAVSVTTDRDSRIRDDGSHSGAETDMVVKADSSGYCREVLLSFDISKVDVSGDFANIQLKLYLNSVGKDGVPAFLYAIGNEWAENDVTWSNKPAYGEKLASFSLASSDAGKWKTLDIKDYILAQKKAGATRVSFLLQVDPAGKGSKSMFYVASRESDGYGARLNFDRETISSVEEVTVFTAVGKAPVLPAQITANLFDGTAKPVDVQWQAVAPEKYAQEGSFTVLGTVAGRALPVVATVRVSDGTVTGVENTKVNTPAGMAPTLPETVKITYITGKTGLLPVVWGEVDENDYQAPGEFTVNGKIEGYSGTVQAVVTVTEPVLVAVKPVTVLSYVPYEPILPEKATCVYSDGSEKQQEVQWDAIPKERYSAAGVFTLAGKVGSTPAGAEVTIVLLESSESPAINSPQGKYPKLPDTVKINGGKNPDANVTWSPVPASDYMGTKDYVVKGVISGTDLPVSLTVHPAGPLAALEESVSSSQDVYIQASPSDSNFANQDTLFIKNVAYDLKYKRDGLVQFDLAAWGDLSQLTGMKLRLYITERENRGTESYLQVYANGSSWSTATATWDGVSQSGYKLALLQDRVVVKNSDVGSYVDIDVSKALPYITKEGKISFLLTISENPPEDPQGDHSALKIATSRSGAEKAPRLEVSNRYVTSMQAVETTVKLGAEPVLPRQVEIAFSDGTKQKVAVDWQPVSSTAKKSRQYLVKGLADGLYTPVTAVVNVEQPVTVNKDGLKAAIDQAENAKKNYPENLIPTAKEAFEAALAHAWKIYRDETNAYPQDEIDTAAETLLEKLKALSTSTADLNALDKAIERAKKVVSSGVYLEDGAMKAYQTLLRQAIELRGQGSATDAEIGPMIQALLEAEAKLRVKPGEKPVNPDTPEPPTTGEEAPALSLALFGCASLGVFLLLRKKKKEAL